MFCIISGLSAGKFEDIEGKRLSHFFQAGKTVDPFELSTASKPATESSTSTIKPPSSLANQPDNQRSMKWFTASKQACVDPFDILDEQEILPTNEQFEGNPIVDNAVKASDGMN